MFIKHQGLCKYLINVNLFYPYDNGTISIPTLQMRKLRHGRVKCLIVVSELVSDGATNHTQVPWLFIHTLYHSSLDSCSEDLSLSLPSGPLGRWMVSVFWNWMSLWERGQWDFIFMTLSEWELETHFKLSKIKMLHFKNRIWVSYLLYQYNLLTSIIGLWSLCLYADSSVLRTLKKLC